MALKLTAILIPLLRMAISLFWLLGDNMYSEDIVAIRMGVNTYVDGVDSSMMI